jgi:poly-gamma-glutamate system protein
MVAAARLMVEAERLVLARRLELGYPDDGASDPNATGLVGVERSGTTTSLGDLAAKRTTTSPDMAALMAGLLFEAGVRPGDSIAVGASGSFPGAVIAALAAARAMDLRVALIASLGSSTWGANAPGFSLLAMLEAARPALGYEALAASLGGGSDSGGDMDPEARDRLRAELRASGVKVIEAEDLAASIRERARLIDNFTDGVPLAAFVNIGGASAHIGEGASALALKPGVNQPSSEAPAYARGDAGAEGEGDTAGVALALAARGVPIVHILDIRKLSTDRGLAWDPAPFPAIGKGRVYRVRDEAAYARRLVALAAVYAIGLAALGLAARRRGRAGRP